MALNKSPSLSSMYAESYQHDPLVQRGLSRVRRRSPSMGPGEVRNELNKPLSSMYAEAYQADPRRSRGMMRRV